MDNEKTSKNFAGIYRDEVNRFKGLLRLLLIHLLISCNHSDNPDFVFDNKPFPLKRGQLITSFRTLSKDTGISLQSTRTFLKNLENLKILTHQSTHLLTNRATLITFIDIDKYLVAPKEVTDQLTHQSTEDQHTPNTRLTTNNKDTNKEKKKNNEKQINGNFEEFYNLFPNKKAKGNAEKAYAKVAKEHEAIMEGLKLEIEYRKWAAEKGEWVAFWKHPATWLNQQCWKDEYTGEFKKHIERIKRNEAEKAIEAQAAERKKLDSLFEMTRNAWMQKHVGEKWSFMKDYIGNQENVKAVQEYFKKLYPKEAAIIFSKVHQ